jgi:hypothetical protein
MDRRLGRGPFIGVWNVLVLAQVGVFLGLLGEEPALQVPIGVGLLVVLQLLKLPITAWRLNDVGRPASDALFFVLIPVANFIGMTQYLLGATPSEKAWNTRRRAWANQLGPLAALRSSAPLLGRALPVVLPVLVVYSVVGAGIGAWVISFAEGIPTMDEGTRALWSQIFGGAAGAIAIYTAIQFPKRKTATRISWLPSLLFVPCLLVAGGLGFLTPDMDPSFKLVLLSFLFLAWGLLYASFAGAGLAVVVTLAVERARKGEAIDGTDILSQLGPRMLDVAGPHGARVQAVTVGMQVLIPGIFYLLQLAFTDVIAVLKPDAAALSQSAKLTWGMRQRLFKMYLLMVLVFTSLHVGFLLVAGIEGANVLAFYIGDPRQIPFPLLAGGEVIWGLYTCWVQAALVLLYHDRVRYLEERRAERRAKRDAKKAADPSAAADAPAPA